MKKTLIAGILLVVTGVSLGAFANSVKYSGQGLFADGFGNYDLNRELCGLANGADADGPYLLWVLTATGATAADITGPWGTAVMTKFGAGTFKYISGWYDPTTLPGAVTATYSGKAKNAQLVISHGCRPFNPDNPAWCSPGFWRNAEDAAWALTGFSRTSLFNATVYPVWYGAPYGANPTLQTVLGDPTTYSGPPLAGTGTNPGEALSAFNATGAFLTDNIPGFNFDFATMTNGNSDTCPIDHHGDFKIPEP